MGSDGIVGYIPTITLRTKKRSLTKYCSSICLSIHWLIAIQELSSHKAIYRSGFQKGGITGVRLVSAIFALSSLDNSCCESGLRLCSHKYKKPDETCFSFLGLLQQITINLALQKIETYSLTVLKTKCPKSRYWWYCALYRSSLEKSVPSFF